MFDIDDTIWTLNVNDGALKQVADADADYTGDDGFKFIYGFHADVLPRGSRIVYSSCEYMMGDISRNGERSVWSEGYEIAAVNLDGEAHERLTKTADFVNYPALSPDGSQVAFVAFVSRNQGLDSNPDSSHYAVRPLFQQRYRIVVAPADATLLDLTKDRAQINRPGYTNRAALFPPVWAPSGKQLAYVLYEGESIPYNEVIFTARLDGTGGSRIGETTALPTWSPNSEELAFASVVEGKAVIYAVKPNGRDKREIWRSGSYNGSYYAIESIAEVSWSPDGSKILFIADDTYLINADGSDLRRLSDLPTDYRGVRPAAWSPGGSRIAIYNPDRGIITISPDGSDLRVLLEIDADGQPHAPAME